MLRGICAAAIVLSLAGTAHAKGTVVAGPVSASVDHSYRCFAVNASTKPVSITIKALLFTGAEVAAHTCLDVEPNATCYLDTAQTMNTCRFDHDGGKNAVRATLEVSDENTERIFIVEGH